MAAIATVFFAVLTSVCLARVGLLIYARGLSWFSRLPGDIRHRSVRTMIYIPVTLKRRHYLIHGGLLPPCYFPCSPYRAPELAELKVSRVDYMFTGASCNSALLRAFARLAGGARLHTIRIFRTLGAADPAAPFTLPLRHALSIPCLM